MIEALAENKSSVKALLADVPVERTTFERKNELNAASPAFARQLLKSYLKEVSSIQPKLSRLILVALEPVSPLHLGSSLNLRA